MPDDYGGMYEYQSVYQYSSLRLHQLLSGEDGISGIIHAILRTTLLTLLLYDSQILRYSYCCHPFIIVVEGGKVGLRLFLVIQLLIPSTFFVVESATFIEAALSLE